MLEVEKETLLKPGSLVVWLRAEQRPVSSAKRNPANAVSFDTILVEEAEALKDTPITLTSPRKAKPVSPRRPANLGLFLCSVQVQESCLRSALPV